MSKKVSSGLKVMVYFPLLPFFRFVCEQMYPFLSQQQAACLILRKLKLVSLAEERRNMATAPHSSI